MSNIDVEARSIFAWCHENGIDPSQVRRTKFARAVRAIIREEDGDPETIKFHKDELRRVPDGFFVDREARNIVIFEVECAHPMEEDKILAYRKLAWTLDCLEWHMPVVVLDRYGDGKVVDFWKLELAAMYSQNSPIP